MKHIKSLGIEVELFLTKPGYPTIVYNAEHELEKLLGYSINAPRNGDDGEGNYLKVSYNDTLLTTDGTPIEFKCWREINEWWGVYDINNYILAPFERSIKKVTKGLLKNYNISWQSFYKQNDFTTFDSPGYVYRSEKTVYHAYQNTSFLQEKKEGNTAVTRRSAGLHLHFGLDNDILNNIGLTNKIVIALDEIVDRYYNLKSIDYTAPQRLALQPNGIYRIKQQNNGCRTLEYRSLIPLFLNAIYLPNFVVFADNEIDRIIEENAP